MPGKSNTQSRTWPAQWPGLTDYLCVHRPGFLVLLGQRWCITTSLKKKNCCSKVFLRCFWGFSMVFFNQFKNLSSNIINQQEEQRNLRTTFKKTDVSETPEAFVFKPAPKEDTWERIKRLESRQAGRSAEVTTFSGACRETWSLCEASGSKKLAHIKKVVIYMYVDVFKNWCLDVVSWSWRSFTAWFAKLLAPYFHLPGWGSEPALEWQGGMAIARPWMARARASFRASFRGLGLNFNLELNQ